MSQNVDCKSVEWLEEALDIYGLIYEKMTRSHRRARMNADDRIVLDSKIMLTTGMMSAAIIDRGSRAGLYSLSCDDIPQNVSSPDEIHLLRKCAIEWINDLITIHTNIYTAMVKNYRHSRISPEDESMLDTKLFESAALMAIALFEREESSKLAS